MSKQKFYRFENEVYLNSRKRFTNKKKITFNDTEFDKLVKDTEFTEINDFEILLQFLNYKEVEVKFIFYSETHGFLFWFPYWHKKTNEIANFSYQDIPIGTAEEPFFDADCSASYIFEKRNYVYFISTNLDFTDSVEYFKVKKEIYFEVWSKIIEWGKVGIVEVMKGDKRFKDKKKL